MVTNGIYPTAPSDHEPLLTDDGEFDTRPLPHAAARGSDEGGGKEGEVSMKLKKELGLKDGVGIIVGIIIGSGIFVSPKGVLEYSGSVGMALVVWAVSGLLSLVGAICYAELGTMIPRSGGEYAYFYEIFGGLPGFLILWVALVFIMPISNIIMAITFANYILQPFFPNCDDLPETPIRLVAAVIVCFLTWLNCAGVKWFKNIQGAFVAAKIIALTLIIGAGMYYLATGHVKLYEDPFVNTKTSVTSLCTAFYQGLFSFAGWNCLNFVVEELRDPYKNLPRAILISLPIVTIVYFLTNVAYFAVLDPNELLSSQAVALTFSGRLLGWVKYIMPVFVALSCFGSLNGLIFATSRLFFVGARDGQLPQALALINYKKFTPVPAVIFQCGMTLIMLATTDTMALINCVSFSESLFVLGSITGLLWLRYKQPDRKRPIKVWIWIPILFFFISLFLVIFPVYERPVELGFNILIFVVGVPVYYIFVRAAPKYERFNNFMGSLTCITQMLCCGLPEEKEE